MVAQRLRMTSEAKRAASRRAAAQRRCMEGAMASAVIALRSPERRGVGYRSPPGGLL